MGYFAVLAPSPDQITNMNLRVKRLHINLWALRGLWFGRRLFHFDVGMELCLDHSESSPGTQIQEVDLLLPFRVEEGKWPNGAPIAQDLYDSVINDHSGPLIFGSPVKILEASNGKSRIEFDDELLDVVRIKEQSVRAIENHKTRADSSLYRVPLEHPLKPGESTYLRMRWRVFGAAPIWKWVRPEAGARIDFRVCDTRQGPASQRDSEFLNRIVPILSANVFVMAPGSMSPTNVSPPPKHIRTLEPGAWTNYLKGAASWEWMARDLLVYGWHRPEKQDRPITEDDPLRVFLAVNRSASRPGWLSIVHSAVGVAVAWVVLSGAGYLSHIPVNGIDGHAILAILGIGSLMALWTLVQRLRPFFSDRARKPRQSVRRIERFFLCR